MDEGGGLENRYMGDCIVGSNPTPSARFSYNTRAISPLFVGQQPRLRDRMSTKFFADSRLRHGNGFVSQQPACLIPAIWRHSFWPY